MESPIRTRSGSDTGSSGERLNLVVDSGHGASASMPTATGTRKIVNLTNDISELTHGIDWKSLNPKDKGDVQKAVATIFKNSGMEEKIEQAAIGFLIEKMPGVVVELMRAWSTDNTDLEHTDVTAATKIVKLAGQFKDYVVVHHEEFEDILQGVQGMSKDQIAKTLTIALKNAWESMEGTDKVELTELLQKGSTEKEVIETVVNGLEEFGVLKEKDTQLAGRVVRVLKVISKYLPNKGIFTLIGGVVLSVIGAVIRNVADLQGALSYLHLYTLIVGLLLGLIGDSIKHYAIDKAHKEKSPIEKATMLLEPAPSMA